MDTPDDEWLNIVGQKKWIVCSHDMKWQSEAAPIKAIHQHKIGCFYLWGASSTGFFKLKSLAHNYDKIKKYAIMKKALLYIRFLHPIDLKRSCYD